MFTHVAAIDVHKRQVTVAVRTPAANGARAQQVRRYPTFYAALQEMAAWFAECAVTHMAMKATGINCGRYGTRRKASGLRR